MNKFKIFGFIIIGLIINFSSLKAQTDKKGERVGETIVLKDKERVIDWEAYDSTSIMLKNEIKFSDLQGLWNTYKGVYRFDDNINSMELTVPFIFEVKNESYRRNAKRDFKKFIIKDNLIIQNLETKIDTGIINKITLTEMTISWKDKSNYTRYFYKR
jgi:hypothetical protein